MDGLEEQVAGHASSGDPQNTAEMTGRVAATCVTIKRLRESWQQIWLQTTPLTYTQGSKNCLQGQTRPVWSVWAKMDAPLSGSLYPGSHRRGPGTSHSAAKSSASMAVFVRKQHTKQTAASFSISEGCVWRSLFNVGGALLVWPSFPGRGSDLPDK